MYGAGENVLIH